MRQRESGEWDMSEREQLIITFQAVKRGEEGAPSVLYRMYYSELYNYVLSRVNYAGKAKELTQDIFVEIFETIQLLDDDADFVSWSRKIADRRCIYVIQSKIDELSEKDTFVQAKQTSRTKRMKAYLGRILIGIMITVMIACVREVIVYFQTTQGMAGEKENSESGDENITTLDEMDASEEEIKTDEMETTKAEYTTEEQTSKQEETTQQEISEEITESDELETTESEEETTEPETEASEPEPAEPFFVGDFQLLSRGTYYEVIGVKERPEYINTLPSEYDGIPVTSIAESAFEAKYVGKWTIPKSITHIGKKAFSRCYGSEVVYVEEGNPAYYSIGGECLIEKATNTAIMGRIVPLDANLEHIGDYAYSGFGRGVDLTIPEGVISIGENAFEYPHNLQCVRIPSTMQSIGKRAFIGSETLIRFYYNGTIAQWNAIEKGRNWDLYTGTYVVHCTDGDITK